MEMCVSATKANGERIAISLPLSVMPGAFAAARTCDERQYDYEPQQQDDVHEVLDITHTSADEDGGDEGGR